MPIGIAVPDIWREALNGAVERWPGVRVETKPHGVAVHYRLAPDAKTKCGSSSARWWPTIIPWFRLIPAREAVEIGLRSASKGHAVERLMGHAPFHGRKPIFIGDDFTDEAGMSMARRFGGLGLRLLKCSAAIPRRSAPG